MESSAPHFNIGINVSDVKNDAMETERLCELYFTDAIYNKSNWWSGEETSMLQECIDRVNAAKPTKIIQYIDSWGGSAPVGFGIYNYLKAHAAKVETKILNNCASIASVMAMAGNKGKITMPVNGMMVIHQAQNSAQGTAKDLRDAAAVCDKYTKAVIDTYVQNNRKGKTFDEIYDLIKDGDYWMTGTEAKAMGFVDDCYNDESITITNSIAKAKTVYNNIPQRILAMADAETPVVINEVPVGLGASITNLFNGFKMKVDEIVAKFKGDLPDNGIVGEGANAINLVALLEQPITNLLNSVKEGMNTEIQNALTAATKTVTDGVAQVEDKYKGVLDGLITKVTNLTDAVSKLTDTANAQGETITNQATAIDAQKEIIAKQEKSITNLSADMEAATGKGAPAAGKETVTDGTDGKKRKVLTFAGKTTPVNVAD